jgi:hypothetical protein
MAKRGYDRDTIRGGASDWDVSRPFSSYLRMLASLLVHPIRFFELLPKIPDLRAPALFLAFCSMLASLAWLLAGGIYPALLALALPLPLSFALAGLYHLGTTGGRHGYRVTWRTVAYPFGFCLPLCAVPALRWVAVAYAGVVLLSVGLAKVREISPVRAALVSVAITGLLLFVVYSVVPQ